MSHSSQADNEELSLYLLQLVQAIKFEPKYAKRLNTMQAAASAPDRRATRRARRVSEAVDTEASGDGQAGADGGAAAAGSHSPMTAERAAVLAASAAATFADPPDADLEASIEGEGASAQGTPRHATMAQLKRGDFLETFLIERAKADLVLGTWDSRAELLLIAPGVLDCARRC